MEIKGDFLGFSFADVRSESLGIVRTSDGDRYSEELQPEIRDITVEVPGMNGNYYFGSTYGPRELSISFAFDSMTEEQFRKMRATFSKGKIGELIFDERPYKAYMAKISTPIELKYICFDEAARTEGGVQEGKGLRVIDRTTTKTSTVSDASEGLTVTLDETTYRTFFPNDGTNTFIYRNSVWYLIEEEAEVVLENYGINATISTEEENISFKIINSSVTNIVRESITPYITQPGTQRIYKGDGNIIFTCYYPFAKSVFKSLPSNEICPNVNEWAASSGMLSYADRVNQSIDVPTINIEDVTVQLYNPGDVETSCRIYFPFEGNHTISVNDVPQYGYENILIEYWDTLLDINEPQHCIQIKNLIRKGADEGFMINTETGIIEGIQSMTYERTLENEEEEVNIIYITSGNIYNEYMTLGHFFKIEPNMQPTTSFLRIVGGSDNVQVSYNYLYL